MKDYPWSMSRAGWHAFLGAIPVALFAGEWMVAVYLCFGAWLLRSVASIAYDQDVAIVKGYRLMARTPGDVPNWVADWKPAPPLGLGWRAFWVLVGVIAGIFAHRDGNRPLEYALAMTIVLTFGDLLRTQDRGSAVKGLWHLALKERREEARASPQENAFLHKHYPEIDRLRTEQTRAKWWRRWAAREEYLEKVNLMRTTAGLPPLTHDDLY